MRHNIVHLLNGEAEIMHHSVMDDIAEKFDIVPFYKLMPSHLTLKRGFESDEVDMMDLYERLDTFSTAHTSSEYSLKGWGQFPGKAIYIDVTASKKMSDTVAALLNSIRNMSGMNFHEYDNGGEFHASVALSALQPFDFEKVWNYLQTIEQPDFEMKFDNIAILKKPEDVWVVDRIFEIG